MEKNFIQTIDELSDITSENLIGFKYCKDYEDTLLHIETLIDSSILLYKNNFINQSFFFTITAIEEISKAVVCLHRNREGENEVKRQKDSLFNHKIKHKIAANDIFFQYTKLKKKIGKEKVSLIYNNLKSGHYSKLRESAIYFQISVDTVQLPYSLIESDEAGNILLLCIELFEDSLFGVSDKSDIITDRVLSKFRRVLRYKKSRHQNLKSNNLV